MLVKELSNYIRPLTLSYNPKTINGIGTYNKSYTKSKMKYSATSSSNLHNFSNIFYKNEENRYSANERYIENGYVYYNTNPLILSKIYSLNTRYKINSITRSIATPNLKRISFGKRKSKHRHKGFYSKYNLYR